MSATTINTLILSVALLVTALVLLKLAGEVAWLKHGMKLHSAAILRLLDARIKEEEKANNTNNETNLKETRC